MAIAGDRVDPETIAVPRRWQVKRIRNFMLLFGGISSVFDGLTFVVLLLVLQVAPPEFRTAWFVESLLTELAILLVVRTEESWAKRPLGKVQKQIDANAVVSLKQTNRVRNTWTVVTGAFDPKRNFASDECGHADLPRSRHF